MTSVRALVEKRMFWPAVAGFFVLLCWVNYHYSAVNQIPSDGPLTIGFPMTFHWMICPMSAAGAGACRSGTSTLGLVVDWIACVAGALAAAAWSTHLAGREFAKTRTFWIRTAVALVLIFVLTSAITLLQSAAHHGRAIEMGFPAVYLREYAGDSWNATNLIMDLAVCFAAALWCVATFSREKTGQSA
jgi:hypothetical protein